MTLEDYTREYYTNHNYNCSETLLHACNDCYQLGLDEASMKMMGGFGGGMFVGSTCGALVGCNAALSSLLIQNKAHEELDVIRPAVQRLYRNFRAELGDSNCSAIKPLFHSEQEGCLQTCLHAARAMEKTMAELGLAPADAD